MPPTDGETAAERRYNPVFERLVDENEDDITGYVAYALYKQKKRDWVTDFQQRNGRAPGDKELGEYTRAEELPRNRDSLKREAQAILSEYATAITESQYEALRERALEEALVSRVAVTLGKIEEHGSLARQMFIALLSTLFSLFILLFLAVALAVFGIDVLDGASKLRGWLS